MCFVCVREVCPTVRLAACLLTFSSACSCVAFMCPVCVNVYDLYLCVSVVCVVMVVMCVYACPLVLYAWTCLLC